MVYINGGTFQMGGMVVGEGSYQKNLTYPVHNVTLSSFYMDTTDVTDGNGLPLVNISWYDALTYCNERSMLDNLEPVYSWDWGGPSADYSHDGYRLPTEAEWEYACRAGSTSDFYWGDALDGDYCWDADNSNNSIQPVATKQPNAWGLYDMNGNVWQWCGDGYTDYTADDQYDPSFFGPDGAGVVISRGGAFNSGLDYDGFYFTSTFRDFYSFYASNGYNCVGFRCVRRGPAPD
jgi:formylglycine-generating enzyme required for sulfatase activity